MKAVKKTKIDPATVYLQTLAPTTQRTVESRLIVCLELLKSKRTIYTYPWHKLAYEDVSKIRFLLINKGYKNTTINLTLAAVKGLLKTCVNLGLITYEKYYPIQQVKLVSGNDKKKGTRVKVNQVKHMIKNVGLDRGLIGKRDRAIVSILAYGGLRRSELVNLKVENCDAKQSVLYIIHGKGRKNREVIMPPKSWQTINPWLKERFKKAEEDDFLFTPIHKTGAIQNRKMRTQTVANIVKRAGISIRVVGLSPHDLRRSFISNLLDSGVDINIVRQLAGHANIHTTAMYDLRGKSALTSAIRGWKI